ncbi:fungal-specific transcription factor domain-containing protein, partial [Dipodascopsis tothii]|uniref:fungal-specific transcription factor domain-containing protein n=1 Tax=Dipodascopsis tothii TaxID=44089 RepID=UPI0034CDB1FA
RPTSRRTIQACERCHKRRTKCDGRYPECSACAKASVKCHYASNRSGAVLYPRGYVNALENRISWIEGLIKDQYIGSSAGLAVAYNVNLLAKSMGIGLPLVPTSRLRASYNQPAQLDDLPHPETMEQKVFLENTLRGKAAPMIRHPRGPEQSPTYNVLPEDTPRPQTAMKVEDVFTSTTGTAALNVEPSDNFPLDHFPTYDVARKYVSFAFEEIVFYPFLNSDTFMLFLEKSYEDETRPFFMNAPTWKFTLFMMMAIGSAGSKERRLSKKYFILAGHYVPKVLARDNIRAIRSLMLITIYSLYDPEGASGWLALGSATRIALGLGLHRNSCTENLNLINQEVRKRVFWSLYALDRVISTVLGRPLSIQDRDVDVNHFIDVCQDPELTGNHPSYSKQSTQTFADVSVALYMVKLRQLSSRILLSIHHHTVLSAPHPRESLLEELHQALDSWKSTLPPISIAEEKTRLRIEIEYHEHLMLLYRPSPSFPEPSSSAAVICSNAAFSVIDLYASLYNNCDHSLTYLSLRGMFVAALTLLWAHTSCRKLHLRVFSARAVISQLE